jgi:hypothetical protein
MQAFDVNKEEINAFDFGERYLFTAYFDENQIFNQLEKYHIFDNYRFKLPKKDVKKVQQVLYNFLCELVVEKLSEEFCIVPYKNEPPSNVLNSSVVKKQRLSGEMFVLTDKTLLCQAVGEGSKPLEKSGISKGVLRWQIN